MKGHTISLSLSVSTRTQQNTDNAERADSSGDMAEAKGSPASSGAGAGVGPGDLVGPAGQHVSFQALLASVGGPAAGAANIVHHHYQQFYNPAALIHAPMPGLPALPPFAVRTPTPPPHRAQSNHQLLPAGQYLSFASSFRHHQRVAC